MQPRSQRSWAYRSLCLWFHRRLRPKSNRLSTRQPTRPPLYPPPAVLQRPAGADDQIRTSTTSVADYFAAKMRARQQGAAAPAAAAATPPTAAVAAPPAETVPEQDPEVQDALEGATLVAGGVAGKKKEGKKRKRKDGVEKADTNRDGAEGRGESKKRRKKRKAE